MSYTFHYFHTFAVKGIYFEKNLINHSIVHIRNTIKWSK